MDVVKVVVKYLDPCKVRTVHGLNESGGLLL